MDTGHQPPYDPFDQADWMAATSSNSDPFSAPDFTALGDIFATQDTFSHTRTGTGMDLDGQGAHYERMRSGEGGAHGSIGGGGGGGQGFGSSEGSSPFSHSTYSYAGSSGGDTSFTSFQGHDLDSFLSASFPTQPSPPFSYGTVEELANNLPPTFDTSALQSLFADPSPSNSASSGSNGNHLSPYSAQHYGAAMQTVSPAPTASSASPLSPYLNAFPHGMSPNQLFTSSGGSSTSSPPTTMTRLSVDCGDGSTGQAQTFGAFQAQQAASRTRTSLAATAGVSVPPLLFQPSSHPANIANSNSQFSFTVKTDPSAPPLPLAMLQAQAQMYAAAAQQNATSHLPQPPAHFAQQNQQQQQQQQMNAERAQLQMNQAQQSFQQGMTTRREKRQLSPVEVIANAGLQGQTVYQAPLLQLRPNAATSMEQAAASATAAKVKKEKEEAASKGGKGAKAKAGGKKVDKGHNAVEQKYRNSINNALATLRDTIPALRHLKPLPSMPATKRKASQFTLASAAIPATPDGLVDGVTAAKTLSKSTILTKAIEYIDFLRSSRDGQNEDLELFKTLVKEMVGGGETLIEEFERRRAVDETRRMEERRRMREEDYSEGEGGGDEDDDGEEELAPVPAAKGKKAPAPSKKRGKKDDSAPPPAAKKARLPTQHISPPLTSDYQHVQALNAAHLESLASQQHQQHFPPSPVSSAEGVSPSALHNHGGNGNSPPRVLLASFMGLSFAGGMSLDWSASAAAEEAVASSAARAWTARLVRRSAAPDSQAAVSGALSDLVHPSVVGGLVALGLASIVVAFVYLLYPLLSRPSISFSPSSVSPDEQRLRRRAAALAALASANSPSDSATQPQTFCAARASALQARKALLELVEAPGTAKMVVSFVKEAVVFAFRETSGLDVGGGGGGVAESEKEKAERAVAWVRIAEIEARVGDELSYLSRVYTFLRLANLSHSSAWPSTNPSPSTSRPAVDALLSVHLLSRNNPQWSQILWNRMRTQHLAQQKKKVEPSSSASPSFVDLAIASSWTDVRALLGSETRAGKADGDIASPSDTVPLLVLAEASCEATLKEAWQKLFVAAVGSTTGTKSSPAALATGEVAEALESVLSSSVDGSEVHVLAAMSKVFLACFLTGTPSTSSAASTAAEDARTLFVDLAVSYRQPSSPFSRLASSRLFLQLFLPVFTSTPSLAFSLDKTTALDPVNEIDLLATAVLSWLLVRKSGAASSASDDESEVKVDAALHARALAVRRLLGHELFLSPLSTSDEGSDHAASEVDEVERNLEDARDALVDALTRVARRAAGLKGGLWDEEDSGFSELEN